MSIEPNVRPSHPQAAAGLEHLKQIKAIMATQMSLHDTETFTARDKSETVVATLDGDRLLTRLYIEEGLGRLGAEAVEQRINEAIANAQAEAMAAIEGQQEQMIAALAQVTAKLTKSVGLAP